MKVLKETEVNIDEIKVSAYKIPTQTPESDGTIAWDHTTLVLVEIFAGGVTGIGYTYADLSTAKLIQDLLSKKIADQNAFDIPAIWNKMVDSIRNLGRPGIASMAISAVDTALWDLKARILDVSLVELIGKYKDKIPVYGSGGFTDYSESQMKDQFNDWLKEGIKMIKMKVGTNPDKDLQRVKTAREIIGKDVQLFVDANGAYSKKQALNFAYEFAKEGVTWFEEPVSSDNIPGLQYMCEHAPSSMNITTGEYGYDIFYFKRLLEANAIDILQADITRCGGVTAFLKVAALAEAYDIPLSTHCAPYLHLHAACSLRSTIHMEYFYDHERIEKMLFDGTEDPVNGYLKPDLSRPGIGMEFKKEVASKFEI